MKSSSLDCGLLKSSSESIEGEAVVRGVAGRACLVKRVEAVSGRLLGRVDTASDSEAFRFLTAEGVVGGGQGAESAVTTESAARWDEGRVGVGERESDGQRSRAVCWRVASVWVRVVWRRDAEEGGLVRWESAGAVEGLSGTRWLGHDSTGSDRRTGGHSQPLVFARRQPRLPAGFISGAALRRTVVRVTLRLMPCAFVPSITFFFSPWVFSSTVRRCRHGSSSLFAGHVRMNLGISADQNAI